MTTQPEALRLAAALTRAVEQEAPDDDTIVVARWFVENAADELRRLHESNIELLAVLKMLLSYTKACEGVLNCKPAGQIGIAEVAINKAERTTT